MLTSRYTVWAANVAHSNGIALQLAGIAGVVGLLALSLAWWPEPLRSWARRVLYLGIGAMYATLFLVGMEALLGAAGLRW